MAIATRWTYEDLVSLGEDGLRHEIIDGQHRVNASPNLRHQRIVQHLGFEMMMWLKLHPIGEIWCVAVDVVFTKHDVVVPDIIYVSNERREILTDANVQGAPDLVVEVLSPSTRKWDQVNKRRLYAAKNVPEFWIVDPRTNSVRVIRRGEEVAQLSESDTLTTPLLPGLEIQLVEIFAA
jgi:Uma2 family endonuclease